MLSFRKDAKIFTEDGLKWVEELETELKKIQATKMATAAESKKENFELSHERSEYSKKMIAELLKQIHELTKHNDPNYWASFWHVNKAYEFGKVLFDTLDGNKGTRIPEVFNRESYEMTAALASMLKKVDLTKHFHSDVIDVFNKSPTVGASELLTPAESLSLAVHYLKIKLRLYDMFNANGQQDKLVVIDVKIEALKMKLKSEMSLESYRSEIKELLKLVRALTYLEFVTDNKQAFLNRSKPFTPDPDKFEIRKTRVEYLQKLLDLEETFNRQQVKNEQGRVNIIFNKIKVKLSVDKMAGQKKIIKRKKKSLREDISEYKKSSGLFTSKEKLAVAEDILKPIISIDSNNFSKRSVAAFQSLLKAAVKNDSICSASGKHPGRLATFTALESCDFFSSIMKANETNDSELAELIKQHDLKIQKLFEEEVRVAHVANCR